MAKHRDESNNCELKRGFIGEIKITSPDTWTSGSHLSKATYVSEWSEWSEWGATQLSRALPLRRLSPSLSPRCDGRERKKLTHADVDGLVYFLSAFHLVRFV